MIATNALPVGEAGLSRRQAVARKQCGANCRRIGAQLSVDESHVTQRLLEEEK